MKKKTITALTTVALTLGMTGIVAGSAIAAPVATQTAGSVMQPTFLGPGLCMLFDFC